MHERFKRLTNALNDKATSKSLQLRVCVLLSFSIYTTAHHPTLPRTVLNTRIELVPLPAASCQLELRLSLRLEH